MGKLMMGTTLALAAVGGLLAQACGGSSTPADQASGDKACCKGKNKCAGKGSCATAENTCAGQNKCAGKGGCNKHCKEAAPASTGAPSAEPTAAPAAN
jgi:hypothetical protein